MPYMTKIEEGLVRFGLADYLEEVDGWETRGSRSFAPAGSVGHHTAGPRRGDRPSLRVVLEGRPDVPGPLANTFTSRSKVILVAAGRANHAGRGGFRGLVGNSSVFGDEAESSGIPLPDGSYDWSEFQTWAFPRVHAAYLWVLNRDASWYCAHRDWTNRKIDPTGIETAALRAEINRLLRGTHNVVPVAEAPEPKPRAVDIQEIEEEDMERAIIGFYEKHIGRTPSRSEVNHWIDVWAQAAAGEGLRAVRAGIATSGEAKDKFVVDTYVKYTGRKPERYEIAELRRNSNDVQAVIVTAISTSQEAKNFAASQKK